MPSDIQELFIRSIKGFEKAEFARYGYAIEYDYVFPNQLSHSLEVNTISGLFLAGQINGTTGYEEAAGQGLIAGINASLKSIAAEPFILDRNNSYIGIMIDDLVTLGVDEPYRMFTSRAERRLILRQDNVFARLGKKAYELGLIDKNIYNDIEKELDIIKQSLEIIRSDKTHLELIRLISLGQTELVLDKIRKVLGDFALERTVLSIYAEILYGPYLRREQKEIEKIEQHQALIIPQDINYSLMPGLSIELKQKLEKYRPKTIAQASLIRGMTPAGLSILIFKIRELTGKIN